MAEAHQPGNLEDLMFQINVDSLLATRENAFLKFVNYFCGAKSGSQTEDWEPRPALFSPSVRDTSASHVCSPADLHLGSNRGCCLYVSHASS